MAITIDGKSYDETKLSDEVKNSIVQAEKQANYIIKDAFILLTNKSVQIKHMKNQRKIFNKSSIFIKQKRLMEEIRKL